MQLDKIGRWMPVEVVNAPEQVGFKLSLKANWTSRVGRPSLRATMCY